MRVLLADGDIVFLEIVQSFLWDHGYEAEIATDGLECISILREFMPSALVIDRDLLWGGSDGVLTLLGEDLRLPDVAVIVTTDGELDEELLSLSSLPVACLTNPYRLGDLLTHLQQAAHPRRSPRSLEETC